MSSPTWEFESPRPHHTKSHRTRWLFVWCALSEAERVDAESNGATSRVLTNEGYERFAHYTVQTVIINAILYERYDFEQCGIMARKKGESSQLKYPTNQVERTGFFKQIGERRLREAAQDPHADLHDVRERHNRFTRILGDQMRDAPDPREVEYSVLRKTAEDMVLLASNSPSLAKADAIRRAIEDVVDAHPLRFSNMSKKDLCERLSKYPSIATLLAQAEKDDLNQRNGRVSSLVMAIFESRAFEPNIDALEETAWTTAQRWGMSRKEFHDLFILNIHNADVVKKIVEELVKDVENVKIREQMSRMMIEFMKKPSLASALEILEIFQRDKEIFDLVISNETLIAWNKLFALGIASIEDPKCYKSQQVLFDIARSNQRRIFMEPAVAISKKFSGIDPALSRRVLSLFLVPELAKKRNILGIFENMRFLPGMKHALWEFQQEDITVKDIVETREAVESFMRLCGQNDAIMKNSVTVRDVQLTVWEVAKALIEIANGLEDRIAAQKSSS